MSGTENATAVGPGTFFAKRERQGNKNIERRGKQREENGKLKEADNNDAGFKGRRFPSTVIQSTPWLKFNEHMMGTRSL